MIPTKDQYVKIIFKNSTQADGFVEEWSDQKAILRSQDGKSLLIIPDILTNVLAIKVYLESPQPAHVKVEAALRKKEELNHSFENSKKENYDDGYLKAKTLLELRKLQAELDKKIVSEKLKDHTFSQMKVPKYELPRFLKK